MPVGGSAVGADVAAIREDVEALEGRLTADRAGYLDLLPNIEGYVDELETRLTAVRASYLDTIPTIEGYVDELETRLTAARAGYLDSIPNVEHETEWSTNPVCENLATINQTNLTAGSITATFPTGATRVRAILVASIHVANQAANTHHIDFKVQGQKDAGGYVDLLDLTAVDVLGLPNLDGSTDGWCGAIDVTTLVDGSGSYDFRFVVRSDNAGSVNYTTCFTLVLVYHM